MAGKLKVGTCHAQDNPMEKKVYIEYEEHDGSVHTAVLEAHEADSVAKFLTEGAQEVRAATGN